MAETNDVAAARPELERAQAEHGREAQRLADAQREVGRLTEELRDMDPDAPVFAKVVAARAAAGARCEALEARVEKAAAALERAREAVAEVERAERQTRVEQLDAQIRERDAAITASCVEFRKKFVAEIRDLRCLTEEANRLDPSAWSLTPRGSRWAGCTAEGAMRLATSILSDLPLDQR